MQWSKQYLWYSLVMQQQTNMELQLGLRILPGNQRHSSSTPICRLQTALILTSCPSTVWPSFSNIHRVPKHAHTHQWVKCLMFWTTSLPICVFHYLWLCQIRRHFCSTRKRQASQVQQWCFSASAKSASKMASTSVTVSDKTGTRSPLDPRRVGANVAPSAF